MSKAVGPNSSWCMWLVSSRIALPTAYIGKEKRDKRKEKKKDKRKKRKRKRRKRDMKTQGVPEDDLAMNLVQNLITVPSVGPTHCNYCPLLVWTHHKSDEISVAQIIPIFPVKAVLDIAFKAPTKSNQKGGS